MRMVNWLAAILAAGLVATCAPIAPAAAVDVKISAMPAASALSGGEKLSAVQGAGCTTSTSPCSNVAVTPAQIATYVASSSPIASAYQPLDSDLTAIAALATTTTGRDLLTAADGPAIRTKAGLGSIATQSASAVAITGGTVAALIQLPSFTISSLPSASTPGQLIYVSNESGGAVIAFSDGTSWRRVTDRAVVS